MVEESGTFYNQGLSDYHNSMILTNVIRSAKGYATYFSALGDYNQNLSVNSNPNINYSGSFSPGTAPFHDVSAALAPSVNQNYSSNVSSLETSDFTAAMYTPVSTDLFLSIATSRERAQLSLIAMLTINEISVTQTNYQMLLDRSLRRCQDADGVISGLGRAICAGIQVDRADLDCEGGTRTLRNADGIRLVRLFNDPTSTCAFGHYRQFVEAVVVLQPRFDEPDPNSKSQAGFVITLEPESGNPITLYQEEATGYQLRSPNATIQYLAQIVRKTSTPGHREEYNLTTSDGTTGPIIQVRSGGSVVEASVVATVDDKTYWIPKQSLSNPAQDYSHESISLMKDLIALNTARDSLPQNNNVFIQN